MSKYGYLFNGSNTFPESQFDTMILDVTEENKHLVLPMLMTLAIQESQKKKLNELAERLRFDLASVELGVDPAPKGNA